MADKDNTPVAGHSLPLAANGSAAEASGPGMAEARFGIGEIVRHRIFSFRGVIFDVDPEFANTEEWWQAIPEEIRPARDQPFYHLLAENDDSSYVAYVSQQNLLPDEKAEPVRHPAANQIFETYRDGRYIVRPISRN